MSVTRSQHQNIYPVLLRGVISEGGSGLLHDKNVPGSGSPWPDREGFPRLKGGVLATKVAHDPERCPEGESRARATPGTEIANHAPHFASDEASTDLVAGVLRCGAGVGSRGDVFLRFLPGGRALPCPGDVGLCGSQGDWPRGLFPV